MTQVNFPQALTDDKPLWDAWMATFYYPALQMAREIGLFELLNDAPLTTHEVADKLGYSNRSMESMLGLLTALGFLQKYDEKHYLAPVAESYLIESSPFFWGGIMDYRTDDQTRVLIREMLEREKTGRPGTDMNKNWEQGSMDPEKAEKFTRAMHSTSVAPAFALGKKLNLSQHKEMLDVAGGSGSYAMGVANGNPGLNVEVMELPEVVPYTVKYIQNMGFSEQVAARSGNMFDPGQWPGDKDVHLFSHIFHDWDADTCQWLAKQSFEKLKKGGKIVLHEILLNDQADQNATALAFSLKMLISMKGKQYRFAEFQSFLENAGFQNVITFPTFGYFSVVIGEKS